MRGYTHERFVRRLWLRIDQSGGPDACWPWTGARVPDGYGHIGKRYKVVTTHRSVLELTQGERPGMFALHTCDNPPCCNPRHLYWGTKKQNWHDSVVRNRRPKLWGEQNHKFVPMLGRRFGKLLVTGSAGSVMCGKQPRIKWLCRCDCGKEVTVFGGNLRRMKSTACGFCRSKS